MIMASFWVDDDDQPLINRILKYKVGDYEKFNDALPGEMVGFRLNIVLFGMAGCGQSSLINTIFKCLDLAQPAVINNTGREVTTILESFDLPNDVTIHETRGFYDLNEVEQEELFRIIYGIERPGSELVRDYTSVEKAAAGGVGAYKLKKPPIADQMHVILWLIRANDIRFECGRYQDLMNFAQHQLRDQSDNVLIVIGGDSYYRDENEEVQSVISRWARKKLASQFREEYLDGKQNFIFSWDKKHRMIHEEAMRHLLDHGKRGSKFECTLHRPLPKPIPPVIPQHLSKPKTPVVTFADTNVRKEIPWRSAAWCVFVVFWRTTEKDPLKSSIKSPGARNVCSPVAAAFACTSSFAVACLTKHGHVSALVRCLGSLWGWCTDRFGGR